VFGYASKLGIEPAFSSRIIVRNIIPITDLQRQSRTIVAGLADSVEPVIITQRGRRAVVGKAILAD